MLLRLIASFVLTFLAFCFTQSAGAFDHRHTEFTNELQKYVGLGFVDYQSWKQKPQNLKRYIDSLRSITDSEYKTFSNAQKKALWLNAYNALTIYEVLKNYPIKGSKKYYPADSIRQVDQFWEETEITIGKRKASLAQIEHNVLRRDFHDPRSHFAVAPAAIGGASLERVAYSAPGLDLWLKRKTSEFLGKKENVWVDGNKGVVHVTQLFRWFPLDFAKSVGLGKKFPPPTDDQIIIAYLTKFGPDKLKKQLEQASLSSSKLHVVYEPFNWKLNDIKSNTGF